MLVVGLMGIGFHTSNTDSGSICPGKGAPVHVCCGAHCTLSFQVISCLPSLSISYQAISRVLRVVLFYFLIILTDTTLRVYCSRSITHSTLHSKPLISSKSCDRIMSVSILSKRNCLIINSVEIFNIRFNLLIINCSLMSQFDLVDAGIYIQTIFK